MTTITRNQLVERVAALYGLDTSDGEFVTRIVGWLDEAINDLNFMTWEQSKHSETGVALTADSNNVTITTPWYRESLAYLVNTADSSVKSLTFLPWVTFSRLYKIEGADNSGCPSFYSVFQHETDSKLYFNCPVDSETAADYTLTLEFYRRVPKVSTIPEGDGIEVPPEFENIILYGGYKRAAMHFGKTGEVSMYAQLEREAYDRMKRADRMHPDADNRFRLVDELGGSTRGTNLIYPY